MKLTLILLFVGQSLQSSAICKCPRGASGTQVCGEDGTTYWNSCMANCSSVNVLCEGTCPCSEPRELEMEKNPTTTTEEAEDDGIEGCTDDKGKRHKLNEFYVSQDGCNKCRCMQGGGACTRRLCGRNIVNTQNRFEEMFDDDNNDEREINPTCNCPKTRMMVCGMNGQTYMNSCLAQCDQTLVMHIGQCNTGLGGLRTDGPWSRWYSYLVGK